jgi:hypothetical protein
VNAVEDSLGNVPRTAWELIDLRSIPEVHRKACFRLNALGSSYFFGRAALNYKDLTPTLHLGMMRSVEVDVLRAVKEYPRAHYKTTCFSIITPMWWALPFTDTDERLMRGLGYGDEWIRWMRRAHDQNTATLILSETDDNAEKMGKEISLHYQNNGVFKNTFPEIMPGKGETWNMASMTHKRNGNYLREGTYELAGVGKALQSRHYPRIVEDDLFGEKALYSPAEAEFTIEFHRKIPGLYRADSERPDHIGDNLVVGNRWAVNDLNGWIRKNQPGYTFETHAVDGGCCDIHPKGTMIFPEMFSPSKMQELRDSFGPTAFAAQFLNNPQDESNRKFLDDWLKHYRLELTPHPNGVRDEKGNLKMVTALQHDTYDGTVEKDVHLSQLQRFIIVDVLHDEDQKKGRSRHAIMTLGYLPGKRPRLYILSAWAKRCLFDEMTSVLFARADTWRVDTIWVEVLAGQDGWALYFKEKNRNRGGRPLRVEPLKKDRSPGAKERRIDSLEPQFSGGMIYACRGDKGYNDFRTEYDAYKSNQTIDLLDVLGYYPQCVEDVGNREEISDFYRKREQAITSQMVGA